MKVTAAPVKRSNYTVHDGAILEGSATARCAVISARRRRWHILEAHATTTCKRCLKIRETKPYVYNRTVAEEAR